MRFLRQLSATGAFVFVVLTVLSLWFGAAGANDDEGSSWSDPGPQRALHLAIFFGVIAVLCFASWVATARSGDDGKRQ